MQSKRARVKTGREKLQHIIELCRSIEERSLDPFLLNVDEIIKIVKEYFPEWENAEDLCLDAEAINRLASVIKLQSEWVKHRSTSLYTDPFLLEEKIRKLEKEEMVEIFLQAWHPIVELEQISIHSLAEAIRYWESLTPLRERWQAFPQPEMEVGSVTMEELVKQRILREKAFTEELENFWEELKRRVRAEGADGKIRYWDFVRADNYEDTVYRAFMTSFLVTYGYATLEIHTLEEEVYIRPYEKQAKPKTKKQLVSVPIAITREDWKRENRQN
ncbi:MAG: hypothetical protein RMJ15_06465 [Nitrososphaerota archaeon]|nr:hypothetical protein [Candidatus Bathyarchaeota archaeon]MDW8023362.1 hypothetical protein [Nitrososphaerota archaeon]